MNKDNKLVSRSQWASYMNTGTTDTPEYNLMGLGFSALSESKNPKEYSRQYVHMLTETTDVVGYSPSISYTADVYSGDPCIQKVMDITDNEKIGSDAQIDIVNVNLWEQAGESGTDFVAKKRTYSVVPDGKGDSLDALVISGTFKAVSDIIDGTFNVDTKTFTPTTV